MNVSHTQATVLTAPDENTENVARHEYDVANGGTNVTSGAYQELIAATARAYRGLEIFDSSGYPMYLATGAAGSETVIGYIMPGGNATKFNRQIPAGTRLSVRAVETTADQGEILVNGIY
ncbi:MAG TPA: hypothetical protein VFZ71_04440 [Pyrinomonadaceae bacterium]